MGFAVLPRSEILAIALEDAGLDIVRRAYEVFDTDLEALLRLCDDKIEWISPEDAIEPGVRSGHEGVRRQYASTDVAFSNPVHEVAGDPVAAGEAVIVPVVFHATGRGSGMELHKPEWHVWTIRGGKAVRFAWFHSEDEARASVV